MQTETAMPIYDFSALLGTGEERYLADYRGRVLLVVNVASVSLVILVLLLVGALTSTSWSYHDVRRCNHSCFPEFDLSS
jgi:hypothetical protein